jgi:hypothetical protein
MKYNKIMMRKFNPVRVSNFFKGLAALLLRNDSLYKLNIFIPINHTRAINLYGVLLSTKIKTKNYYFRFHQ